MSEQHLQKRLRIRWRSVIIALPLLACSWLCITYRLPYDILKAQEKRALPLYDALNEAVLAELPPPPGAIETKHSAEGITSPVGERWHGRKLFLKYERGNNSAEDIVKYYTQSLSSLGCNDLRTYTNHFGTDLTCIRNTACIMVEIHWGSWYPVQPGDYAVDIWHDYWGQSFSPRWPNMPQWKLESGYTLTLMEIYDLGWTYVMTCP